jgi:hypothetical protein
MRTLIFQLFLGGGGVTGRGRDPSHRMLLGEEHQQKQFDVQTEEERLESIRYNRILGEYYLKQVEEEGNHELRTIQALSTYLVKADMIEDLREFLLLPRVFKVMFSSDLRIELLLLWSRCLSASPPASTAALPLLQPSHPGGKEEFDRDGGDVTDEVLQSHGTRLRKGKVAHITETSGGSKNLAHWYREMLASEGNDIDDPAEEAQVFCLLGDFFLLTREEAQGLDLDRAESESFYKQALALDPKATSALIGLSRLSRDQGDLRYACQKSPVK